MAAPASNWPGLGSGGLDEDILSLALEKSGVDNHVSTSPNPPLFLDGGQSSTGSYPSMSVDDLFSVTSPQNMYTPGYQGMAANSHQGDYIPTTGWVQGGTTDHIGAVPASNGSAIFSQGPGETAEPSIEDELTALLQSTETDCFPTDQLCQGSVVDTSFVPSFSSHPSSQPQYNQLRGPQIMDDFDVLSLLGLDANGAPPQPSLPPPPPPPTLSQNGGFVTPPMRKLASPSFSRPGAVVSSRYSIRVWCVHQSCTDVATDGNNSSL